jgi:hypothetical protein
MVKILLATRDVETTLVVVVSKLETGNYIERKHFLRVISR